MSQVPKRFREFLDQIYAATRNDKRISLDGQNIFVYRGESSCADVEFGVGVSTPFDQVGNVVYSQVPGGNVATTTHWGDYAGLGAAHDAVVSWCRSEGNPLAGVSWEVYGHWHDDPAQRRTDVYHLLAEQ